MGRVPRPLRAPQARPRRLRTSILNHLHPRARIRCPLLRLDPAQRHRLEEIRDNLHARIAEAEREGWAGEAEGLKVSLNAANDKLAQADLTAARHAERVNLGIPAYRDIAAATLTTPGDPREH